MRLVARTVFHTRPGERDQALAIAKKMTKLSGIPGAISPRFLTSLFSSDSSPDIIWEEEIDGSQLMDMMKDMEAAFQQKEFQELNAELVKHLAQAAKTDLYVIEE